MGFSFRKSIKLGGGFKINFSKSGIGYSWGVKGFRLTKTARGSSRATASIPGTGISYSTEHKSKTSNLKENTKTSLLNGLQQNPNTETIDYSNYQNIETITSSIFSESIPKEYKAFLKSINKRRILDFSFIAIIIAFFITGFIPVTVVFLVILFMLHTMLRINLFYEFDTETSKKYNAYLEAWKKVSKSRYVWKLEQKADIYNKKELGNSDSAVKRVKTRISFRSPWWIKSNVKFPVLNLINQRIIFLPDKILVIKLGVSAISIQEVIFDIYAIGYMETEKLILNDSELIKKQWVFTNKNGEPDKRYKNNIQLPVYKYGMIKGFSDSGLNFGLMISNEKNVDEFDKCLKDYLSVFKGTEAENGN